MAEKLTKRHQINSIPNVGFDGEANGCQTEKQSECPGCTDQLVQLTQKQLDDLINRAFAKGVRKGKRQMDSIKLPSQKPSAEDDVSQVSTLLHKARQQLLLGTIKQLASDLGISTKGTKVALKLADFSHCIQQDDVAEQSVKEILSQFLKEYPEFAREDMGDALSCNLQHRFNQLADTVGWGLPCIPIAMVDVPDRHSLEKRG